ncbi:MAG: methionine synthase [Ignavibacteria bacterium]|nr:methionine synthase [Ignavibacteria bacterium]
MNALLEKLLQQRPVVTDGAWGTQIQWRGLEPGGSPDSWNLTHPSEVEQVARSYVEAGSRVILTNTFGASRTMLQGHGLEHMAREINRAGAAISRRAAGEKAFVFGSIGPSGRLLVMEEISEGELSDVFAEQAESLAEGGAQAILVETMSDLAEAKLAVAAAKKTGLVVIASMVYDSGKEYDRTMMGTTPEQAAQELAEAGADAIGANCGMGIEYFSVVSECLRAATSLPLWIKPNAGLPEVVGGKVQYKTTPEQFAEHALAIRRIGADFIGGCCGTSPEFIRALVKTFAEHR